MSARNIANYFDDVFLQTGSYPLISDAMKEMGVSRATVKRALRRAGITLPRGRKKADG